MTTLTIDNPGYGIDTATFDLRGNLMLAIHLDNEDGTTQALVLDADQIEQLRQLLVGGGITS